MAHTTRRIFMLNVAACGSVLAAAAVQAQTPSTAPKLDEKDPQAMALGYVADTTKADAKKYPKHANDQKCGVCQLYQGKAADAYAPCPIFAGRQVANGGWCSSFIKKAA